MAEPAVKLPHPPGFKPGNTPEFSVSELAGAIKRALEEGFGHVRLRGEVSGYRGPHASGHCYFALKDETAKIDAVIWKGVFGRLKIRPEEGMEVIAQGRVTSYPGSSKYQIVVESLEPAGVGALMALLEERKRRFAAEGLFAPERKRTLPFMPRLVGIVTSPTGAVIRDMLAGFSERFPTRVIVWPVRVQGETSGGEVANAIRGFNELPSDGPLRRPDVLIVARGGGSLEDLWGFNDEAVVRAVADSTIPIVSAVGHETDWTLIDLAADARAPTPTKAAEWVVPKYSDLLEQVSSLKGRLAVGARRLMESARTHLKSAARGLPRPEDLVRLPRQRFDSIEGRLQRGLLANTRAHGTRHARVAARLHTGLLQNRLIRAADRLAAVSARSQDGLARLAAARRARYERAASRLRPAAVLTPIARANETLAALDGRRLRAIETRIRERRQRLESRASMLSALSYQGVLARGFAIVRDGTGAMVRRAAEIAAGAALGLELADGEVRVQALEDGRVRSGDRETAAASQPGAVRVTRPRGSGPGNTGGQGTLF